MNAHALAATYAAAFAGERGWSAQEISDLVATPGTILIGDATCFLIGRCSVDEAEILTLATHPDHQRRGHARRLLENFETQIRGQAKTLFLEVDEANIPAQALYFACGFTQLGLRRGYYRHAGKSPTNALVLGKNLT